jgi:hypothetical protein
MSYVQKVKENSAAMLDHLEIQLKPDMDSILRCSRLEAWDPTAAVSMEGGANFPEGTGNIESVTIVQRSEKRPDKVFCANVISDSEGWRDRPSKTHRTPRRDSSVGLELDSIIKSEF